ncbi:MAG: AAA family ATPase [Acidobacteria bacterium]|nr:AAA family ATPase [Acidobacteriota bacterium]
MSKQTQQTVPRIEYLQVKNYRALKNIELKEITPLTVFLGRNGSGKSTIFDVFAFLSECFSIGLRKAWDKRGRFKELRTRGEQDPIVIELQYRQKPYSGSGKQKDSRQRLITYHIAINEDLKGPYIDEEWLQWRRLTSSKGEGRPFRFLNFNKGKGVIYVSASEGFPNEKDERTDENLDSREMLAVNTLGQFAKHPYVSGLRRFITSWYLSYLTADNARSVPEAGPQEQLSTTGNNLVNVIQYLKEQHPERLGEILDTLSRRIPHLEKVESDLMPDGRLLLQIKDVPFDKPIQAKFVSDGTLKMLAYLTVLYDPSPPQLIGIEEPENHLYPHLLPELAEECGRAANQTQLMVTTHSPFFINGLKPEEVRVVQRNKNGYTEAKRAFDIKGVKEHVQAGAQLGYLWMEGFLDY